MATEQSSWRYFLCALLIGSGALEQQAMSAQAAAKESGVAATTYAQSRVALAQILPVNDEVLSSAARYRVGINAAQNHSPAAPALCSLVREASTLGPLIASQLSSEEQRLLEQGGAAKALDALTAGVAQAAQLLPGVGLVVTAEGVRSFVDYGALANLAAPGSVSQQLLREMGHLWPSPNGWPVFIEQQTDVGGCTRPEALTGPIQRIGEARPEAPECLKKELEAQLVEAVSTVADSACLCTDEAQSTRALRGLAAALNASGMHEAEPTVASALSRLPSGQVRFQCVAN